jgi:hypothetical protein
MTITPPEILVARWNAMWPPGTSVSVTPPQPHRYVTFEGTTLGEAHLAHGLAIIECAMPRGCETFPIECIEHRIVESTDSAQAAAALGMMPLSELIPDPLLNLRDIPQEQWAKYDGSWVVIPASIAGYIAKLSAPPTDKQCEHIERHIADFHGLPRLVWRDGEGWLESRPTEKARWWLNFTFEHRFIPGTAQFHDTQAQ